MSNKETGGPAFPRPHSNDTHRNEDGCWAQDGMTLRDYFAAKALQGMLADLPKGFYGLEWKQITAEAAYQLADAMLQERNK